MSRVLMNLDSKQVTAVSEALDSADIGYGETSEMEYLDVHSLGMLNTKDVESPSPSPKAKQETKTVLPAPERASVFSSDQKRYRLQKMIGKGGFAAVSLATDQDIQRRIAIKTYTRDPDSSRKSCQKELEIMGVLEHPGIPSIYDFGKNEEDQYYCTMQYIEGETLRSVISRLQDNDPETHLQYPFPERGNVIIQLLRAVKAAHSKGIIHRDIKPDNIMIGTDGTVFLIDWGIAKKTESLTNEQFIVGTPCYMSPEQTVNDPLTFSSDIYAVAAVLYEFLCLERTIQSSPNLFVVLRNVREATIRSVDAVPNAMQGCVPSEFKSIVHTGLEKELKDRYQSADEMLREMIELRNGEFCPQCARTIIKSYLHRYMRWLDRKPYPNLAWSIVALLAFQGVWLTVGWGLQRVFGG